MLQLNTISIFFFQNKNKFQDAADDVTFTGLKYIYFNVCNLFMVVVVILRKHIKLIFLLYFLPPKYLSFTYGNLANEKQYTPLSISTAWGQFQIVWDSKNIKGTITFFPQHYILTLTHMPCFPPVFSVATKNVFISSIGSVNKKQQCNKICSPWTLASIRSL